MPKTSEKGFLNIIVLLAIVLAIGVGVTANIPIKRDYSDGKTAVLGVSSNSQKPQVIFDSDSQAIVEGQVGALTNLKAEDLAKKPLNVLPTQALKNLQASGILSEVNSVSTQSSLARLNRLVKLEEKAGVLGYQVEGFKKHSLAGLPLKTQVKAFVSAENGQVVWSEQSLLGKILNKIAY